MLLIQQDLNTRFGGFINPSRGNSIQILEFNIGEYSEGDGSIIPSESFQDFDPELEVRVVVQQLNQQEVQQVTLRPNATPATNDIALWVSIWKGTESLKFENFNRFVSFLLCGEGNIDSFLADESQRREILRLNRRRSLPFTDTDSYRFLKVASEAFVMSQCAVLLDQLNFNSRDLRELEKRLVLRNGPKSPEAIQAFWLQYLREANGIDNQILPYFSIVLNKLSDQSIKRRDIGDMFINIIGNRDNPDRVAERCTGIISEKLTRPCFIELIWSYWMEEAMLVQSLNAISQRFQNIKRNTKDPLANLAIAPLRLLNNLLWGYIQDEQHRLTVVRRNYEYDHQYGISLQGKAIPNFHSVDSRPKFLDAFHQLLHLTIAFYKQSDDTTVIEDGFPLVNALKEVHLILSEGAHNQYGDLPVTARIEMLMQQWILARPEFREFLPTKTMTAYPEPWMDRVAAMNQIQGWTDSNLINFLNLAIFGEQLLLSIRFGDWTNTNDRNRAANWANFWREQIQGYIHAYRAVTGVDLAAQPITGKIDSRPPSYHLLKNLTEKVQGNGKLLNGQVNGQSTKTRRRKKVVNPVKKELW